jgi:hypothetical protein
VIRPFDKSFYPKVYTLVKIFFRSLLPQGWLFFRLGVVAFGPAFLAMGGNHVPSEPPPFPLKKKGLTPSVILISMHPSEGTVGCLLGPFSYFLQKNFGSDRIEDATFTTFCHDLGCFPRGQPPEFHIFYHFSDEVKGNHAMATHRIKF